MARRKHMTGTGFNVLEMTALHDPIEERGFGSIAGDTELTQLAATPIRRVCRDSL